MTVIIPKDVYLTIIAASVRFGNQRIPFDDWLEVYGVFIGKNGSKKKNKNDVFISAAYPITHQVRKEEDVIDKVYWSTEDYESLYIIDDEAFSKGEFVVGWWHSHPGFKVMMSHIDIRTTLSYQTNNPLAISLVFNPVRLTRQIEMPNKKGDPDIKLKNDAGFKIFRLDDVNQGIKANYHEVEFQIEGYESMEHRVKSAQKFVVDITNFFPKEKLFETYEQFISDRITQLNSKVMGTSEYLQTLVRKGEADRVSEVLETQKKEIRAYVGETFMKVENIKEFMNYLEYKERGTIIPQVETILSKWDEEIKDYEAKLEKMSKIS